jgi:hypothetical protein
MRKASLARLLARQTHAITLLFNGSNGEVENGNLQERIELAYTISLL